MLRDVLLCLAVLIFSRFVSKEEQRARDLASDQAQCNAYGLDPGSLAYMLCMTMVVQQREDARRSAAAIAALNSQINQTNQRRQRQDAVDFKSFTSAQSSAPSPKPATSTGPVFPSVDLSNRKCTTTTKVVGNTTTTNKSCHN